MTAEISDTTLIDLFRTEAETQNQVLSKGLLALERDRTSAKELEALMRAAHSLKGAARIVGVEAAVDVSHTMENCFVAAQAGALVLERPHVDVLLEGVDLLAKIAESPEAKFQVGEYVAKLNAVMDARPSAETPPSAPAPLHSPAPAAEPAAAAPEPSPEDRVLRVTANHLNRLLGLAGESRVEARWLDPFARSLLRLKRMQVELARSVDALHDSLTTVALDERTQGRIAEVRSRAAECRQFLGERLVDLEMFDRRSNNLSHRLYDEALACRMRPFMDGAQGFPRMVRDVARLLGKEVRLVIVGEQTQVDRDVLEKLEAPLNHMLRNAIDHGIEMPEQRIAAGKPLEGTITLEARHSAGMLLITLRDDGRGIDVESVRRAVVDRKLTNAETAAEMRDFELFEFLFLPGFTLKKTVTEISGRGVGLDVVLDMMKKLRGTIRISSEVGKGTTFQMQLPLTLSVLRALLVEIAGEPYGVPLAAITRTIKLPPDRIATIEGRQHFDFEGQRVGLVTAHQIFDKGEPSMAGGELSVIVVGDRAERYGLIVDRFLGERELVVQPLDPRLGKIKDISAGALMDDGTPLLIVDIEDLVRSVQRLSAAGRLSAVRNGESAVPARRKRILVVDDSLTVREFERKLLEARGYDVEVAIDGMDGWNAARLNPHDLIITDVDMPRMDGIELVSMIRKDPELKSKPVMIVSYKDREQDRARGLEAGADYYLTKGSFHDETLVQAVADLIGGA
ncbi:MAG TPA: hybrid sensor histidine kinase/response regulator [Chthoniobacteraceae bacterium]|jgi:two-component system sensor histidine kinase and response regulator WspE|nr:hybrid sensor histidine kinase/response regulator [Chthoniobacteraceae bacterium]